MASTYVNDLRLNELGTGDGSGTWGTTTNTNLELIAEAFGFGTEAITTNANTHSSEIADGATDPARSMYIKYTGALDSDCTITIGPNNISRVHLIENATTDSGSSGPYNIIIKQGSGSTVTIPNGQVAMVYLDGAGSGAKVVNALTNPLLSGDITATGTLGATGDTSTGDSAAIGFTSTEGIIITGQGSTNDVTIKNDADADVIEIPTGTTNVTVAGALTAGGILKTDDATDATSTTDGSLQTDGGLSVAKDTVIGNDIKLISDSSVIHFGVDGDVTLTHNHNAGLIVGGTNPAITIGDAGEEDTKIVFDGNAQDFHIGLDDSADDLLIGKGSVLGATDTTAISVDENRMVTVHNRAVSGTIVDEGNSGVFDLADGNNLKATPTSTVSELTFSNPTAGQSGNVLFDNSAGATVSQAHSAVAINASALTSLSTAGVYFLTYYCTAGDSSANSILVSVSGALT